MKRQFVGRRRAVYAYADVASSADLTTISRSRPRQNVAPTDAYTENAFFANTAEFAISMC